MNITHFTRRSGVGLGVLALVGGALFASAPAARAQDAGGGDKSVTINLQNAPVQTVLRSLFKSAGKNFTIDPGVGGTVNVDVNQVPFDTALQAVLTGANPPLTAPLQNGIYQVQVDRPQPAPAPVSAAAGATTAAGGTPSTDSDPHHAYKIPVEHYDAAYMAYLIAAFSKKGGPPIIVPSDPNAPTNGGGGGYGGQGGQGGGYGNNQQGGFGGQQGGFGGSSFGGQQGGFGGSSFGGNSFGGGSSFGGGGGYRGF